MITDNLLTFVLKIFDFFFSKIPEVNIVIPDSVIATVFDIIETVAYFFPMSYLTPIFYIISGLWGIRFGIRVIRTTWDLLPLL